MRRARSIIVDADACPVKSEIEQVGKRFGVQVVLVASFDHRMKQNLDVKVVQVDRSDQSVDLYIANHIHHGDILVTQDFGLAALGLAKGCICLTNRGQEYTDSTIDFLLERRHVSAKLRRGGKHTKGPRPFTEADREQFLQGLTKLLSQLQEIENE
ncbi:YaiI/YqxD family protein [Paenibacillus sp. SYP-B3998]|uniref:UPF0178 protein GK047_04170 n=1 Tax=Paenibacillus sp. SYP-B3998 TaxID=2678564 RepID=A0A6G3ZSM3_9BACL|nr:YaiI/YqxD family protein [Paenibacillus sp. SYP-B3998]NEW05216.1 YaiI/YqxD family protein [Paenibacillus sp. SYP-B3998]